MSKLTFQRNAGIVILTSADTKVLGVWKAHNKTASNSNGPWPDGTWPWSHYNPHPEAGVSNDCYRSKYGCFGGHVFRVAGREGMGVHAGRTQPVNLLAIGGKTDGCIRVPPSAMLRIQEVHAGGDPLREITVEP